MDWHRSSRHLTLFHPTQGPDAVREECRKVSAAYGQPQTDRRRVIEKRAAIDGGLCPAQGARGRRPAGARSDWTRPGLRPRRADAPSLKAETGPFFWGLPGSLSDFRGGTGGQGWSEATSRSDATKERP
ncbi:hypothetical protein Slala04_72350 [Streptomyces lavendulae subsp. lavendulae]|nr:hypothetical protein Slala04_72350 [Streptomyces lavendulae subsp. lavendulae]